VTWLKTESGDNYILEKAGNLANVLDQQMRLHNWSHESVQEPLTIRECGKQNQKKMAAILKKSGKSRVKAYDKAAGDQWFQQSW
jgi:hypothetical protein